MRNISLGLAAALLSCSMASGCKKDFPTVAMATVLEDRVILYEKTPAEKGMKYLLKLRVEEPDPQRPLRPPKKGYATKPVTYFVHTVFDDSIPYELFKESIHRNAGVIFPYRDGKGELQCPINRMCSIPIQDIYVLSPFENPVAARQRLEAMHQEERKRARQKRNRVFSKRNEKPPSRHMLTPRNRNF